MKLFAVISLLWIQEIIFKMKMLLVLVAFGAWHDRFETLFNTPANKNNTLLNPKSNVEFS